MIRSATVALVLFILAAPAWSESAPNPVVASGYRETSEDRPLLEAAIKQANAILRSGAKRRLASSWDAAPSNDAVAPMRVYLVAASADTFTIETPFRSCNCIFLQPAAFRTSLNRYSTKLKAMLKIEPRDMLGFMLLHEVGHIVHNDLGSFDKQTPEYNFDETAQKLRESAADRFAADSLGAAEAQTGDTDAFLAAMRTKLALTNASWNLSALRLIDGFGGSALCSNFLFADKGGTHPNFELRILTVNNLLGSTEVSRELLAAFEKCRKPSDSVIYRQ